MAKLIKPDLILLDIMMPDMDGFEVCHILKNDTDLQKVPVIFITLKNETHDIVKCFKMGGVDFIAKPYNELEFLARI